MATTTIGQLRLKQIMPEGFKNIEKPLNSKELSKVMTDMAKSVSREVYVDTLKKLTDFGFSVANDYGGIASAHLRDVKLPPVLRELRNTLRRHVYRLSQRTDLDPKTKNKKIIDAVRKATPIIDEAIIKELSTGDNSFGLMVGSGVKGKPAQLRALVFGDLLTVDSKMRDIPYPTLRSYGEGITPLQYWAASHGGRYGYIQVQKATADAGYFSKQTRGVVHRQVITMEDCGRARPYVMDTDDDNAVGSLLYRDTKGKSGKVYKADTILTSEILEDLGDKVQARSAICCGAGDGVCSKCAGVRESGRLPDIGEAVGLNGINASNEQITQGGLCLHGDTQVLMADGSSKAIKDIEAGDLVVAKSIDGGTFDTPVVALHKNGIRTLWEFTTESGRSVVCTADHKFLTDTGILPLADTGMRGAKLRTVEDVTEIFTVTDLIGEVESYDIEIDTKDHLFVLANGLVVSNSSKHGGGESTGARRIKRGFAAIDQFINMPENFVGGASVASTDGKITKIEDAPQGGKNIHIGDTQVYVPTGFKPTVKVGQYVEAGDLVSEGMVNTEEVTKYKGLGAGRRTFVEALYKTLADNGAAVPKKQLEPFARAYIDRVEITDPDGLQGWIYGDIASYNVLEKNWKPRMGSYKTTVEHSSGKYLELPVMHYTIGTRMTPSVIKDLQESGVREVTVNSKEAPFTPYLTSAKQFTANDPDWISALSGEGLTKSFMQHVQRGSESKTGSTSYYPDLALIGMNGSEPLKL